MKVEIFFFLFLINSFIIYCQDNITINFKPFTRDDCDLIIKSILEQNGYNAKINYNQNLKCRVGYSLDYTINYRKKLAGLIDYIEIKLYYNRSLVNKYEEKVTNIFAVNNKQILNALNYVFNEEFSFTDNIPKRKMGLTNISFYTVKLDSAKYFILAKAPGMYNLEQVEKAFIKKAKLFFDGFEYYMEGINYNYSAHGGYIITNHSAYMVRGIIIGSENGLINKLANKPVELDKIDLEQFP